jgi:hypothetical protein
MKKEEKTKYSSDWLEKWEKESYEKGWKEGRKEFIEKIDKHIKFWNRPKPDKIIFLPTELKNLSTESLFNYVKAMIVDVLENLKKEVKK